MTSSCNGRDDSSKVKVFFPFILNDKEILINNKKLCLKKKYNSSLRIA